MSWHQEIPIKESRVSNLVLKKPDDKKSYVLVAEPITYTIGFSTDRRLHSEGVRDLERFLANERGPVFEEIVLMWREAISERSIVLRFFLLYRLLEKVVEGRQKEADRYIREKKPSIELVKDRYGNERSIITFLRNNVHPESAKFPFEKLSGAVNSLQAIVKESILERWPKVEPD